MPTELLFAVLVVLGIAVVAAVSKGLEERRREAGLGPRLAPIRVRHRRYNQP
jgi:hypothetical protein